MKHADMDIADLVDFYHQWPDLRDTIVGLKDRLGVNDRETLILQWMIMVMDRVGPADIETEAKENCYDT